MDVAKFKTKPLLGIVRGVPPERVEAVIDAACDAGLETIEFAANVPEPARLIERAVRHARGRLAIGAGTVMDLPRLRDVRAAGASFIVLPVCVNEVVAACVAERVPVFPGAMTPMEIYAAYQAGATMVKVFPAKTLGSGYIKEVKGPFPAIPLLACGGIAPDTLAEFFKSGADAVAFGGSIFRPEWMNTGNMPAIVQACRALVQSWEEYRCRK